MFRGIRCETTRTLLTVSSNSAMENKPTRPGPSKDKVKKQIQPKKQPRGPWISDNTIIPRVKQYLDDHNNSGTGIIDVDEMVDELRAKFPEYARRKRGPFKQTVRNAFDIVYKTWGMTSDMSDCEATSDMSDLSSASDKDVDLDDDDDEDVGCNRSNDQMVAVYLRQPGQQAKRKRSRSDDGEKELINISSDEDVAKNDLPVQKPQNGAPVITAISTAATLTPPTPATIAIKPIAMQLQNQIKNPVFISTPRNNAHVKPSPMQRSVLATSTTPLINPAPKKKTKWKEIEARKPSVTFKDFGGSSRALEEVCKLLIHVRHPEVYNSIGITPPRGFLLHGPPGCGKTLLAHAIAGELGIPLLTVAGPELVAGVSGESEERIRDLFVQATENAPCILFLDEVDAITPNRHTAQREMERRIVAQFLYCLDELSRKESGNLVVVIGATNRPDSLDPALRRAGRFDREVSLGIPDKEARINILQILCKDLKLSADFSYEYIAKNTPGFVGADLMALIREASMVAVNRVFASLKNKPTEKSSSESSDMQKDEKMVVDADDNVASSSSVKIEVSSSDNKEVLEKSNVPENITENQLKDYTDRPGLSKEVTELMVWLREDQKPLSSEQLNDIHIELDDFKQALKSVQPSAKREGFATVPDVTWDDVGSLNDVREELQMTILAPVRYPEEFAKLGISTPSGVLLCGPPGCGKTLLAKAIANEAGINFISVKGPELLNMYVGESEKAVRQCFQRARNSAPCVIFFDELDALCPKRSDSGEGGASMRVVNQMLTEMDGIESRRGVFLMAASNRPEIIDPAVLRPGRLDKIIYIGLPSSSDRVDILKALTKDGTRPLLDVDINLKTLGESEECSGYTGADLAALVREAGIEALKEHMGSFDGSKKLTVCHKHFMKAQEKIRPSVSEKNYDDICLYPHRNYYYLVYSYRIMSASLCLLSGPGKEDYNKVYL
ncbi:Nuclear valosin-containing protein [Blattella germanica]|nr:Nuclear valosin-containing protein [Blattella germanica]